MLKTTTMARGSLELGINTIVVLVIAIVVLGLGVSFVVQVFTALDPEVIDLNMLVQIPDAANPLTLTPSSLTLKAGEEDIVDVGVYNALAADYSYMIDIRDCTGSTPEVRSVSQVIEQGAVGAYRIIVGAYEEGSDTTPLAAGNYICKLFAQAQQNNDIVALEKQFTLTVIN